MAEGRFYAGVLGYLLGNPGATYNGYPERNPHGHYDDNDPSQMYNGAYDKNAHQSHSDVKSDGVYYFERNNAERFKPKVNPARQQFNGIVNFYFNAAVPGLITTADTRNGLSSLVKTAQLPSFEMQTQVQNQYNKKRVTVSGVEYKPINITVYDTVDSAWVQVLMRSYQHLFLNPMGKFDVNSTGDQTTPRTIPYDVVPEPFVTGTAGTSQTSGFAQNYSDQSTGYNIRPGVEKNFINRIDFLMYHAQRYVRYSVFNPLVTSFNVSDIDYSSSQPVEIQMNIDYETFSFDPAINLFLEEDDMKRFTNFGNSTWKALREQNTESGADGWPGGNRTGADTNDMPSLKPRFLDALAPETSGNEVSNRRTEQNQQFWNNFKPG